MLYEVITGRSLEYGNQTAGKTVGSKLGVVQHFNHHTAGTTSAKGFHECRGQPVDKARIEAQPGKELTDAIGNKSKCPRSPEYSNSKEHGYQVGYYFNGNFKAFLGSFNKGFVEVNFASNSGKKEEHDKAKQNEVTGKDGYDLHLLVGQ